MDEMKNVVETIMAAILYMAWRLFLIYCLYHGKGPKAVGRAFGMALAIVITLGLTGVLDMTNRLQHLEYYFNAMVFSSVFLLGYIGFWRSAFLFFFGYSTARKVVLLIGY